MRRITIFIEDFGQNGLHRSHTIEAEGTSLNDALTKLKADKHSSDALKPAVSASSKFHRLMVGYVWGLIERMYMDDAVKGLADFTRAAEKAQVVQDVWHNGKYVQMPVRVTELSGRCSKCHELTKVSDPCCPAPIILEGGE